MVKIAIIGHYGGNIGHDFMAEGVKNIVRGAFENQKFESVTFEQHNPFCVYNNYLSLITSYLKPGKGNNIKKWLNSENISTYIWEKYSRHLKEFNLALVAGGPNIVKNVGQSGDMQLMSQHMLGAFHYNQVPLLNLSNGACFPLENVPAHLDENDKSFWRRTLSYSKITTVRDVIAQELLKSVDYTAPLIPCPALICGETLETFGKKESNYIIINYQKKGANEDWGQKIDENKWKETIITTVTDLLKNHKVIFLCHNQLEEDIANKLNINGVEILQPKTMREYAKIILGAKVGLVSRIHAAIPLASIGVPSLAIGTDTRLEAVKLLGLEAIFVKNANSIELTDKVENLIKSTDIERNRLLGLRKATKDNYINLIKTTLKG